MTKWHRATGSGYRAIHDAFNRLRQAGVELQHLRDLNTAEKILDYLEIIVADDELWRRLPEMIDGCSVIGMRADLEGVLSECARPLSPED